MKSPLHFVHGNGFPSSCYHEVLTPLSAQYNITTLEKVGHNQRYAVSNNWPNLVAEVLDSIKAIGASGIIGVGHSLGGALTLMAALRQPSLFKHVILLDSPVFSLRKSWGIKLLKKIALIDHVTPAARTKSRRLSFDSLCDAMAYFRTKTLFKDFSDNSLKHYVNNALSLGKDGRYHLVFDRDIEYHIYRTVPDNIDYTQCDQVKVTLLYGQYSDVVGPGERKQFIKKFGNRTVMLPGSHMFPFEHPGATVEVIQKELST